MFTSPLPCSFAPPSRFIPVPLAFIPALSRSLSSPHQTSLSARQTSLSPRQPTSLRHTSLPSQPSPFPSPSRLQLARLRVHLLRATRGHPAPLTPDTPPAPTDTPSRTPHTRTVSAAKRQALSERMRAKWADPEWRAAMLVKRRDAGTVARLRAAARRLWRDPEYRARMRAARLGREAPNKGKPASEVTRLRMSIARKGWGKSVETRRRMSAAKKNRPSDDDWPRLISEGKKGKTKEYLQVRREFRALHRDLKLWSDSYRARYGRLPNASSYERFVAPMMVFRVRRYLALRDVIGSDEPELQREIITRQ